MSFEALNQSLTSFQSTMHRHGSKNLLERTGMIDVNQVNSPKVGKMDKEILDRVKDHYCSLRDCGVNFRPIQSPKKNPFSSLFITDVKRRYERTFKKREMHQITRSGFNKKLQHQDSTAKPLLEHSDTSLEKILKLAKPPPKRKGTNLELELNEIQANERQ